MVEIMKKIFKIEWDNNKCTLVAKDLQTLLNMNTCPAIVKVTEVKSKKTFKIENMDVKVKIIKLEKENKVLKNKFKRKSKLPRGLVTGIPKKKSRRTK